MAINPKTARYSGSGRGPLAIAPSALGLLFALPVSRENTNISGYTVVDVAGPLTNHDEGLFDSYDAIRERFAQACSDPETTGIALLVDSPGGECHGAFELSRELRAMAESSGKTFVSYADAMCCSAGYAIAASAPRVIASPTSTVGSIGVLTMRFDASEALARDGLKYEFIVSGKRKAYGAPELPMSEAERSDTQRQIDDLAEQFHALVQDMRGVPVPQVAAMEAGVYVGRAAVAVGLVDAIGSFEDLFVSSETQTVDDSEVMSMGFQEICDGLAGIVEGGGEEAEKAQRMLKAVVDSNEPSAEGDGPGDEGEEEEEEEEEEKTDESASASSLAEIAAAHAELKREFAAFRASQDAGERKQLLAGLPEDVAKIMATKPIGDLRTVAKAVKPKPQKQVSVGTVKTPQPAKVGSPASPAANPELDQIFGLATAEASAVTVTDNVQTFRVQKRAVK